VRTAEREDLPAMAARAMRESLASVGTRRWGEVHQTVSRHSLGSAKPLDLVLRLNLGPDPRGGSLYTVNVGDFGSFAPPFTNTHAASFRQVVDMAAPDSAGFIITSGQSGNPLSRHYRDQKKAWFEGRLTRISSGGSVLTLVP
jgi:penicillin amidase